MKKVLFALTYLACGIALSLLLNACAEEATNIPNWIKSTAKFWVNGDVSDNEFENGITYLVENKIIKISEIPQHSQSIQGGTTWVKNLVGMWINGKASDEDFTKAIEYMKNMGIITGNSESTQPNIQNQAKPTTSATTSINQTLNSSISTNDSPALIGSGIGLQIINNTANGFLTINGEKYYAPNLIVSIKENEIILTGYVKGSFNGLLMATGVHTTGIEYNFNGAIVNGSSSVPFTFTAFLTSPAEQSAANVIPPQTIPSSSLPQQVPDLPMMMLTSGNNQAYMAHTYKLVVKVFYPKTNPQKIFDQFYGGIPEVNITVTFIEPDNKVLVQTIGKTDSKGIYIDEVIMPHTQYSQEQVKVIIKANKKGYITQQTTLPVLLVRYHS